MRKSFVICLAVVVAVVEGTPQNHNVAILLPEPSRIHFGNESIHRLPPENLRTMTPPRCTEGALEKGEPCVDDADYDTIISEYVKNLLERDNKINTLVKDPNLKFLLSDSIPNVLNTRISTTDFNQESPVCAAQETLIHPRRAQNPRGEWLFVVNQDEAKQAIRVEKCIREGSACNMGMKLPTGATTICRQKYIYRRLLTVGTNRLQPEDVLMPSCCVCYASQSEFDITSRFRNTTGRAQPTNPSPNPSMVPASPTSHANPPIGNPTFASPPHANPTFASPPHANPHPPVEFPSGFGNNRHSITYQTGNYRRQSPPSIFRIDG